MGSHSRRYLAFTGAALALLFCGCTQDPIAYLAGLLTPRSQSHISEAAQPVTYAAKQGAQDVQAVCITSSAAMITWTSARPSMGMVQWGTSDGYESSAETSSGPEVASGVPLTGLKPGTTYHYRVTVATAEGVRYVSPDLTFATLEQFGRRTLAISGPAVSRITGTEATITWTTDAPATSRIEYGRTAAYDTSTPEVHILALDHSVDLTGLTSGVPYHFRMLSHDMSGNEAVSRDHTLNPAGFDSTTPAIRDVAVTNITHSSATVSWATGELASGQVEYSMDLTYRYVSEPDSGMSHTALLEGLAGDTGYHFRIRATDIAGNVSTSPDATFVTATLPRILGVTTRQNPPCPCSKH